MKKAMAFVGTMLAAMTAMAVTAFADPSSGLDTLTASLTGELSAILPQLASAAGTVIGAVAPVALTIAGMIAVVSIVISVFRRLVGR